MYGEDEVVAATRIQALHRGKQARRRVGALRAGGDGAAVDNNRNKNKNNNNNNNNNNNPEVNSGDQGTNPQAPPTPAAAAANPGARLAAATVAPGPSARATRRDPVSAHVAKWMGVDWDVFPNPAPSSAWFRRRAPMEVDAVPARGSGSRRSTAAYRLYQEKPLEDGLALQTYGCVDVGDVMYVKELRSSLEPGAYPHDDCNVNPVNPQVRSST